MKLLVNKLTPYLDIAIRLYLAYIFIEYGVSKFTGEMFNNATAKVLNTPLKEADLFHLTWYTFQRQQSLSCFIGGMQLISAALLVVNRTVLFGCFIAFPIFINIMIIDFSCMPTPHLGLRILFYILITSWLCYNRIDMIKTAFSSLYVNRTQLRNGNIAGKIGTIILSIVVIIILEILFTKSLSLIAGLH